MLNYLSKNIISKIKYIYKENEKEILDVVLFGSITKGKENPKDIDILIIYKEKENIELNNKIKSLTNTSITSTTYQKLFNQTFLAREGYLLNGISLINNMKISDSLGFSSKIIFRYELKGFNKSNRMRFYYAMYGRDYKSGIIKDLNANKFSDSIIIVSSDKEYKIKEFLDLWKIEYISFPILIPTRITDSKIFS